MSGGHLRKISALAAESPEAAGQESHATCWIVYT